MAVDNYEENFQPPDVCEVGKPTLDPEFEHAWSQEFGFTVDDLRRFVDLVEDAGMHRKQAVYRIRRSELIPLIEPEITKERAKAILNALALGPRNSWRTIPDGFDEKDIQPWRFRRRLSAVRRPLIQLDCGTDPEFIVAPGFVRECVVYLIRGYHEGSFPDWQYRTTAMRSWYGKRANKRGGDFAEQVGAKIQELGWKTAKREIEVKEILGCGRDPEFGNLSRFGDVDVLAWNEAATRLLVIECKHLQFHKTAGEVAEQLSDYRGRTKRSGKPDDLLKHLNRLEVLNARQAQVCKSIGVDAGIRIEGWILFKYPVPMLYAWKEFEAKTRIATFDDIDRVLNAG